jgi:hypothetical protein
VNLSPAGSAEFTATKRAPPANPLVAPFFTEDPAVSYRINLRAAPGILKGSTCSSELISYS